MLDNIRAKIDGNKVYILGAIAILGAIGGWASGAITPVDAIKAMWVAALTMAGRSTAEKIIQK